MKKGLVVLLGMVFVALLIGSVAARDAVKPGLRPVRDWSAEQMAGENGLGPEALFESAAADTYCIVWYTFEQMNWMGFTRVDQTAQVATFYHVDDFNGLGGGDFGGLVAIEGTKSMWCGARPNLSDPYMCSWKKAPGYGNGWNQLLQSSAFTVVGAVTWSFECVYDSEPDYDYTHIEYDAGGLNWTQVAEYTADGDTVASYFIPVTTTRTKLRYHFTSDGAWSDQDGLWNTDGGSIVDDITVHDNASFNNYQNFESAALYATSAGPGVGSPLTWTAAPEAPFGKYSGLKSNLADKDPCGDNFATQVVFFVGSPFSSGTYPGLYDTPFCAGPGGIAAPCQEELIVSPVIDMTKYSLSCNNVQNGTIPPGDLPLLGGTLLRFTVYRDLPLPNLVFYQWHVRSIVAGCPGQWKDRNYVYYGPDQDFIYTTEDISQYLAGDDPAQISMGATDMCDVWYLENGNCAAHTPSPWIDNMRLYRYKTAGPQWAYRDLDFFQDNFPLEEAPPWGKVRADAANDVRANNVAGIDPGDSITVDCSSMIGGGIDTMPNGLPAVYMYVKAYWIGAGAPPALGTNIHGVQLQGTYGLWLSTSGVWDKIQCDFARTQAGVVENKYMVDLNDSLFVPGYRIDYYFTATDNLGVESAFPRWARSRGPYFNFTCLPTGNSDVLFVNDFAHRGSWEGTVQDYWLPVFDAVLPADNQPDIYHVSAPSSGVSNGPGSRANAGLMRYQYVKVVWDSGDLESVTISDGTVQSDKSNDCQLLIDWMTLAEHKCGLWVCGDDIGYDLTVNDLLSTPALTLMSTWCGVTLVNTSYFDVTGGRTAGGVITPLLTGDPAGIFWHGGTPDTFYAYGGCFVINQFDCLEKTANGQYALAYPPYHGINYYGGIQALNTNASSQPVRTMWFGFSYQYVRNDTPGAPIDRFTVAKYVFDWMQNVTNIDYSGHETPAVNSLAQNFPNPFNPSTTIKFDLKDKGLVSLKVYNVAGQLVRTLVNEVRPAGSYEVPWNGLNDRGSAVASGIYFYKMETNGFSATKKMVMLR
jgi:hypothetical protein